MKFKTKTDLAIHIQELVDNGYLKKEWKKSTFTQNKKKYSKMTRIYTVNFDRITLQENGSK